MRDGWSLCPQAARSFRADVPHCMCGQVSQGGDERGCERYADGGVFGDCEAMGDLVPGDWVDRDHAHFLVQSVPMYSPTTTVQTVKSITAREVFAKAPEVNRKLWGGEFWGKGYFVDTVGQLGSEKVIAKYVKSQAEGIDYH